MDTRDELLAIVSRERFDHVRIADASADDAEREAGQARRIAGDLAGLAWMNEDWLNRATDPGAFLPGARSVIMVALNYHAPEPPVRTGGPARGRIARYARGRDYHRVFEKKLRRVARAIREEMGAEARATVDYGPLLERPLAARSGMGWAGKSTMLLTPGVGPWTLLGAVATTLVLEPDPPLRKSCGSCTRCITACPTGAIAADGYVLDARLCISYHTIENRGAIPVELRAKFGDRVFGCDDCLDGCPVGATNDASHPDFVAADVDAAFPPLAELLVLDEEAFAERFRGRPIMRAKRVGMARNAAIALGNTGGADDLPTLVTAMKEHDSPLVRGHTAWAAGRLAERHGLQAAVIEALKEAARREADGTVRDEISAAMRTLTAQ